MQRMLEHGQSGKIVLDPRMTREEARQNRDYFLKAESSVPEDQEIERSVSDKPRTPSKTLLLEPQPSPTGKEPKEIPPNEEEMREGTRLNLFYILKIKYGYS